MAEEFLYLTTTGHKSGNLHQIEIWFVAHGDCFYLCSEHWEQSHWVQNIRQTPQVTFFVTIRDEREKTLPRPGIARVPDQDAEPILTVKTLFDQKYDWSDGLIIEICPTNV